MNSGKTSQRGITALEISIALAIVIILGVIAIPSYMTYKKRMYFSDINQAVTPYKNGVITCYNELHSFKDCDANSHHVPADITTAKDKIALLTVTDGVITIVPVANGSIGEDDIYILSPTLDEKGNVIWTGSGQAVTKGYAS